jgi:hypothetical protein
MNATSTAIDPVLQRLHEVTDRIRQRAAEERARREARARRYGQGELPLRLSPLPLPPRRAVPVPRHWSEGPAREDEQNAA